MSRGQKSCQIKVWKSDTPTLSDCPLVEGQNLISNINFLFLFLSCKTVLTIAQQLVTVLTLSIMLTCLQLHEMCWCSKILFKYYFADVPGQKAIAVSSCRFTSSGRYKTSHLWMIWYLGEEIIQSSLEVVFALSNLSDILRDAIK